MINIAVSGNRDTGVALLRPLNLYPKSNTDAVKGDYGFGEGISCQREQGRNQQQG